MFDVGFSELCMVALVSLLVIGPEKLPQVARVVGFWLGKSRKMVASVKAEIQQELQAEELRQMLQEQTKLYKAFEAETLTVQDDVLTRVRELHAGLLDKPDAENAVLESPAPAASNALLPDTPHEVVGNDKP